MKKLIFIKFYKDITISFLTALLTVGIIVWTIQAVNYFDFVTEDGHGLKIYFIYSLLNFPKIIHRILPFIFFVSVFYTIVTYEKRNEIYIFWINGISKIKFLNKLLSFTVIIFLIHILIGSYFSPLSKLTARKYIKNSNIDFFTSLIKEGKFINITKGLTIFIEKKGEDGSYKNIFLEENNKNELKMIYADKGILIDDKSQKTFKLFNGRVINIEKSKVNLFDFDQINFNLSNLKSKTIITPKIQEIDTQILLSCFLNIENNKFKEFRCENDLIKEVKLELIKRLYKPFYILLIILFSCYLVLFSKNENNYKTKVNLIFILVFFLLVLSEISVRYSTQSLSFTILYYLLPIILFICGYYNFYRLVKNV